VSETVSADDVDDLGARVGQQDAARTGDKVPGGGDRAHNRFGHAPAWNQCYDFLKILSSTNLEKMEFFAQNKAKLCKNWIITLVLGREKRQFFRRKLAKIAENCDHNIDPWDQCYDL
jgi:hypothetical protein